MTERTHIYFASDFHLGVPSHDKSLVREKKIVRWLSSIAHNAKEIYLVGDVFDFWFEYKYVAPKGFIRLLGKIAELSDAGVTIHLFTGNHDMWLKNYLPQELGIHVHREPVVRTYGGKTFFIGHGDGLGPGDARYKFLKACFSSPFLQWCFERLHPNLSFGIAHYWSRKSRIATGTDDSRFLGEDKEWLMSFCKDELKKQHIDYFIFGHRHLPLDLKPSPDSRYINLGEWINYFTYAEFDGSELSLKTFEG